MADALQVIDLLKEEKITIYGEGNNIQAKFEGKSTIVYFKGAFKNWYSLGSTILHEYYHIADYYSGVGSAIATSMYKKYGNTLKAAKNIRIKLEERAFRFINNLGWGNYRGNVGISRNNAKIQFGKTKNQVYHTFRHTDALGLNREIVKSGIQSHLKKVSSQMVVGKPFIQQINIEGQKIQYTAFKLLNGVINIGRIHGIK